MFSQVFQVNESQPQIDSWRRPEYSGGSAEILIAEFSLSLNRNRPVWGTTNAHELPVDLWPRQVIVGRSAH